MSNQIKKTYDFIYQMDGSYNYEPIDKIEFLLKLLEKYPKNVNIIDVGCGKGHYSRALIKDGFKKIVGVEISSFCSQNFLTDIEHTNADFLEYSREILTNQYDICLCMDVLEHIEPVNIDTFLSNIHRISKECILGIANHSDIIEGVELHLIRENSNWWKEKLLNFYDDIQILDNKQERFFIYNCKKY